MLKALYNNWSNKGLEKLIQNTGEEIRNYTNKKKNAVSNWKENILGTVRKIEEKSLVLRN